MERLLESPEEWELPVSPDKVFLYIFDNSSIVKQLLQQFATIMPI